MRARAINGRRSRSTTIRSSSSFTTLEPSSDASEKELKSGEIDIFVGRNYILSVRHRTQKGFGDVRARSEREPALLRYGAGFVLYALMDTVVDRYFPILDSMEAELEQIEEQIFVRNAARSNIELLYALKQKLMVLKHAIDPLMEATGKLYGGRVPQVCTGMQEYFRDVYDHLQPDPRDDRRHPRHDHHGDPGQPRHDLAVGKRGDEEARRVGGHHRRADDDRRRLRHELQAHAGARLGAGLSGFDRDHGRDRRLSLHEVQEDTLVVAAFGDQCTRPGFPPGSTVPDTATGITRPAGGAPTHAGCSVT
jgi:hypothetical protein